MRVVAGSLRGRRIELPKSVSVRPTSGRVREAIFSTLNGLVEWQELAVLDLYAGSGLLGIEALSRGARSATFVERDAKVAELLSGNLERLGISETARVIVGEVEKRLGSWSKENGGITKAATKFGLIFADPPYAESPGERLVPLLAASGAVGEGAVLVVEEAATAPRSASEEPPPAADRALRGGALRPIHLTTRRYSGTEVTYYRFELPED